MDTSRRDKTMDTSQSNCKCSCSCIKTTAIVTKALAMLIIAIAAVVIACSGMKIQRDLKHEVMLQERPIITQIYQQSKKPDLKSADLKQAIVDAFPENGQIYIPQEKLDRVADKISQEKSSEMRQEILKRNLRYNYGGK